MSVTDVLKDVLMSLHASDVHKPKDFRVQLTLEFYCDSIESIGISAGQATLHNHSGILKAVQNTWFKT